MSAMTMSLGATDWLEASRNMVLAAYSLGAREETAASEQSLAAECEDLGIALAKKAVLPHCASAETMAGAVCPEG